MPRLDDLVRRLILEGVQRGVFPGAAAAVVVGGETLAEVHAGLAATDPAPEPLRPGMRFDVASLTKVVATTPVVMQLVQDGRIDLDRPLGDAWPDAGALAPVTPRHLLAHASGLPEWKDYFREFTGDHAAFRTALLARIAREGLECPPGVREAYSDPGFIVLQHWLERLAAVPFAELTARYVLRPLGLAETGFRPAGQGGSPEDALRYVPTERCPWRGRMLRGEVHDENAWAMGGVAAHAGLFSTSGDLARFGRAVLAWYHERPETPVRISREIVRMFCTRAGIVPGSDRCLGWDGVTRDGSSSGRWFYPDGFGHTGFTGTSLWIEPHREVVVVLLSNRIHPRRGDPAAIRAFRPHFHDALMEAIR